MVHILGIPKKVFVSVLLAAVICAAFVLGIVWYLRRGGQEGELDPPDVVVPLPPSPSIMGRYHTAAVVSNGGPCANIGNSMFTKGGSAMDAAIATLLCDGVACMQSMGLGGGFLMTIYSSVEKKVYTLNARETAPAAATLNMFHGNGTKSVYGGLSVAVPGEIMGYWEAHKKFGKLNWKDLFQPTIDLCEKGVPINENLAEKLKGFEDTIRASPTLREVLLQNTDTVPQLGDRIKLPKLAKTLRVIAKEGVGALYWANGTLTKNLVKDIQNDGGIITVEDMTNYRAEWREPEVAELSNNLTLYSVPLPGSGPVLAFILRLLDTFIPDKNQIKVPVQIVDLQRIVEAYKHAYGRRTELGDPLFENMTQILNDLRDKDYITATRNKICDTATSQDPRFYGAHLAGFNDHGTANVAVLAPNGDAVAVTSTVNLVFGSKLVSRSTGIILNNEMDDFSAPYIINSFGVPPSPANYIKPGKRPMSSMCPSIIVDHSTSQARLVIGAAGGTKITTSTAFVTMLNLWFNMTIKEAIDAPRIHHQLFPMKLIYEYGVLKPTVQGLQKIGHSLTRRKGGVATGIAFANGMITANADFRRPGTGVAGVDPF